WCQGYSEPGAGSDLAGLQTKAEDMGDHYLVNGSKIWTSYGNYADWIFCLVRTDPKAPKHQGISFLLFDMTTPGVSTKPIKLISGASVFAETFFENVKVPKPQLVGTLNAGWTIAKALLQHERNMIGGMGGANIPGGSGLRSPSAAAKRYAGEIKGKIADPALRLEIAKHNMNSRAFGVTGQRMTDELKAGAPPGPASSMFKYYGTEQNKRKYELLLAAMGTAALGWEGKAFEDHELAITREWLRSKGNSIEGGTSEVQLNIIAKNVLRLPD
ncbi:MAG: acyl-CoA dehydrogenase family protein, partial [Alphaproteobacteria bacterium]|nr:acyl-CoA dehydrogenase family protein [Alphaproteobacteria bacterium]